MKNFKAKIVRFKDIMVNKIKTDVGQHCMPMPLGHEGRQLKGYAKITVNN